MKKVFNGTCCRHQERYVTNNRLQQLIDNHSLHINKVLEGLVDKGYLDSQGIEKGTKYLIGKRFKSIDPIVDTEIKKDIEYNDFSIDESKIIEIIKIILFH